MDRHWYFGGVVCLLAGVACADVVESPVDKLEPDGAVNHELAPLVSGGSGGTAPVSFPPACGGGNGRRFETERLLVANKSGGGGGSGGAGAGDPHVIVLNPWFSDEKGTSLQANAVEDYVTYRLPDLCVPGAQDVKVRAYTTPISGIVEMRWSSNSTGTWTSLGQPKDFYSSGTNFVTQSWGSVNWSAGPKYVRFVVTGKNPLSTNYAFHLDYIHLTPG